MKLTAKAIDLAQPADKEYMLSDGDKLYLRVLPSGGKRWLFNYMSVEGRRIKLTLGPYPEISLATARDLAAEQRRLLAMGKDRPWWIRLADLPRVHELKGLNRPEDPTDLCRRGVGDSTSTRIASP